MQRIALKGYGKYFLCHKLALSGRLAFFQKVGDGENADSRFSFNWDHAISDWKEQMASMKERCLALDTSYTPEKTAVSSYAGLTISSPSTDVLDL